MASKEEIFLMEQLKRQSPEGIKEWLLGNESMVALVMKHRKLIKAVLKMRPELRKQLAELTYEKVVENVCSVHPQLKDIFKDEKVRAKVESELATIKSILLS